MDKSIDKNNAYRQSLKIVSKNLIITKKKSSTTSTISYIVLRCSSDETKQIIKDADLPQQLYSTLLELDVFKENITQVIFCGNLIKFKGFEKYVQKFPLRRIDIKEGRLPHYRQYTKTVEEQKNIMWLINVCHNAHDSWKSVITKLGSTHGVLLKITINK